MQRQLAFLGHAVRDGAFELRIQRQHGAEDFAERSEIVVGNPAAETQQLFVEHRSYVERTLDSFCGDRWFAVVQFNHNAGHTLLAKGHEHAATDDWHGFGGDTVGEHHVERHGQSNVAEFGH
jgi:hypothetical protein